MLGISVIIPAYNRENLIGDTLQSLLNQTLPADEIIVVDDGSSDGTANAARETFTEWESEKVKGKKSPEFKVIRQENQGPAAARNAGFSASKGEFIHFFDSDDIALPNKQEVQLRALQESGADIAYGPWVKGQFLPAKLASRETRVEGREIKNHLEQRQGTLTFIPEGPVLQQQGLPKGDLIQSLLTTWSIVPHACLFRRSIVEKSGGFPEHLFGSEDQMMFLKCLLAGAQVIHSPDTLELYRLENDGKLTAPGAGQKRHAAHWARFLLDADAVCRRHGVTPQDWFCFRRRLWEAAEDLRLLGIKEKKLTSELKSIQATRTQEHLYGIHRALERKWGGLKSRITKSRAPASFRSAPITHEQIRMIESMGLQLQCSSRL